MLREKAQAERQKRAGEWARAGKKEKRKRRDKRDIRETRETYAAAMLSPESDATPLDFRFEVTVPTEISCSDLCKIREMRK
jgi:hypothetical protein